MPSTYGGIDNKADFDFDSFTFFLYEAVVFNTVVCLSDAALEEV